MQTHHPPPPSAHRCKVCKKSFPCGRSLGGHMRSHVNMVALAADDDRPPSSYALRENPKKTWRLSDSLYGDAEEKCCAECGKEFLTWRALFGHIKSHRPASEEKQEPENRGVCEITTVPQRRPRSRRTPAMASCSFSSSEHEREDEDGAISLMMLSRDCGFWLGSESSAKNSVFSEGKDYGKGTELDQCVGEEFKKTWICSSSTDEFGDSGEELAKASSGTGIEATPLKKGDEDVKNSSTNLQSFEADRVKLVSNKNACEKRSRFECLACKKTFRSYQALGGHRASHKRLKGCGNSCSSRDTGELVDPSEVSEASFGTGKKSKEHECSICGKVFSSGQALGGHKRCHPVATSDSHDTASLLDLNFPANADGDSNSTNAVNSTELKTWWIEGSLDHEAVVSVISSN